ncbi:Guanine nucleotide-binding protein alpha-3 subunit [Ranunculus cassubicifolius]
MAIAKSVSSSVALVLIITAMAVQTMKVSSQECSAQLTTLNTCAPFVVPGANGATPSSDCCNALQGVNHDCLCNTLRIAAQIPAACNLPALTCGMLFITLPHLLTH